MPADSVTRTRDSTRSKSQVTPIVNARAAHTKSRRGLIWSQFFGQCPRCGEQRAFTKSGLRVCPCGARINLVVTSEVA